MLVEIGLGGFVSRVAIINVVVSPVEVSTQRTCCPSVLVHQFHAGKSAGDLHVVVDQWCTHRSRVAAVEAGDVDALAQKMECLVDDVSLRVRMGLDAWKDSVANFRGNVVLDKLENAYRGICP